MKYSLVVENFRGSTEQDLKAAAAERITSYLANSGDTMVDDGPWDYRVLVQEQHAAAKLEENRIEWPWTFRVTVIHSQRWDVRWRGAGDIETDRGVTYALDGVVEIELESFLRERRAAAESARPHDLVAKRLWAPPGVLRDLARDAASSTNGIVVVSTRNSADLTIEPEAQVEGRIKWGSGESHFEGIEERADQQQRVDEGLTFVPSEAALDLLGWNGRPPADDPGYRNALLSEVSRWLRTHAAEGRSGSDGDGGHVFISYVSEDSRTIDRLQADLEAAGIEVWRDRTSLKPGQRWKDAIRRAIASGSCFISCFSPSSAARSRSYMREELTLAVEELRVRSRDRTWFLPVVIDNGEVPDWPIGAGETLRDFNYVSLTPDTWAAAVERLVIAIRGRAA